MNQSDLIETYIKTNGAKSAKASALTCNGRGELYTYAVRLCRYDNERDEFVVTPCRVSSTSSRHTNALIRALHGAANYRREY